MKGREKQSKNSTKADIKPQNVSYTKNMLPKEQKRLPKAASNSEQL